MKEWVLRKEELKSGEIPEMNILSGKLTGHRPATIVGNMNLKGNGDLQMPNCAKLKFVVFSFVVKEKAL